VKCQKELKKEKSAGKRAQGMVKFRNSNSERGRSIGSLSEIAQELQRGGPSQVKKESEGGDSPERRAKPRGEIEKRTAKFIQFLKADKGVKKRRKGGGGLESQKKTSKGKKLKSRPGRGGPRRITEHPDHMQKRKRCSEKK